MCGGLDGLGGPLCLLLGRGNVPGRRKDATERPQKVGEEGQVARREAQLGAPRKQAKVGRPGVSSPSPHPRRARWRVLRTSSIGMRRSNCRLVTTVSLIRLTIIDCSVTGILSSTTNEPSGPPRMLPSAPRRDANWLRWAPWRSACAGSSALPEYGTRCAEMADVACRKTWTKSALRLCRRADLRSTTCQRGSVCCSTKLWISMTSSGTGLGGREEYAYRTAWTVRDMVRGVKSLRHSMYQSLSS